jgi:N-acetylmuramoyl-L-alanine amidase
MAYPNFYEIKNTKALAVYCECEFHDTREGANFIINNTTAIGEAIAKGICDYYGVKFTQDNKNNASSEDETLYVVQVGAFKSKENAQKMVDKLKKSGYESFITKK